MKPQICAGCKQEFQAESSSRKYCSLDCYWKSRKGNKNLPGAFRKGNKSWNEGTKGIMKPNSGSFQKGKMSDAKRPIGFITTREDKFGKVRAWIKIADNGSSYDWEPLAVRVWKEANGPIPKGQVVHHKDRDTLNDSLDNLELLNRAEHLQEHRHEHERKRKERLAQALKERSARNRIAREQNTRALETILC